MTIALISIGIACALAMVAIALMATKLANITPGLVAMGKTLVESMKAQAAAEVQRDEALIAKARAEASEAEATRQLTHQHAEFVSVLKENADAIVKQIRFAPDITSALDAFNGVLPKVPDLRADTTTTTSRPSDTDLEHP
jgi:uncharacterized membrane protein YhiD involved in acid resistance